MLGRPKLIQTQMQTVNTKTQTTTHQINIVNASTVDECLNTAWQLRDLDSSKAARLLSDIFAFLENGDEGSAIANRWHACSQVIHCFLLRRQLAFSESLVYGLSAAATLKDADDQIWLGRAYGNIGTNYLHLGMRGEAIQFLLDQLEIGIEEKNDELTSAANHNLGIAYMDADDYVAAVSHIQKSFRFKQARENIVLYTYAVTNLAQCWIHLGKYEQAKKKLADCLKLTQTAQEHHAESVVWRLMGELAEALSRDHDALTYYNKSLALNQMYGNQYTGILLSMAQGRVHLRRGHTSMALSCLKAALSASTRIDERTFTYQAHELLAEAFLQRNNTAQALYHHKEFHRIKEAVFNVQSEQKIQLLKLEHESKLKQIAAFASNDQVGLQYGAGDDKNRNPEQKPELLTLATDFHELRTQLNIIHLHCSQLGSLHDSSSEQQRNNANHNIKKSLATTSVLLSKIQSAWELLESP